MVPAIAIRLKECLDELDKRQYKHLPESVIRKGIRQFDLGATTNTSQWFNKKDGSATNLQLPSSRKNKEHKVCVYIRRSAIKEHVLLELDKGMVAYI